MFYSRFLRLFAVCFASQSLADASPLLLRFASSSQGAVAPGVELRILPLRDSITYGWTSPDKNGYRLRLLEDLAEDDVVYAGVNQYGNMTDNWNAGYPGTTIAYIASVANQSLAQQPNIILLHAGTNDMSPDPKSSVQGVPGAAQRLGALIDQIAASCPSSTILVAQIINAANATQEANILAFNKQVPGVVEARRALGVKVLVVDFSAITVDLLFDGLHPTEQGYQDMGDIWYQAMLGIPAGWIQAPVGPDPVRNGTS